MEPTETNALKPTISFRLQSSTAVHSAPLWLMKPTEPGRAMVVAKVAFRPESGLITPRQLGPITRMSAACASSSTCRSSAAPSGPISLKPAEITMAPRTPFSPHSRMMPGMEGGGVTTTARSTCSGHREMARVSLHAQHAGPLGIDRIDRAAERAGHQVPQQRAADGVGGFGGADHRDGLGRKEHVQRLLARAADFFLRVVC